MTQVSWALFADAYVEAIDRPVSELQPLAAGYLTALVRSV